MTTYSNVTAAFTAGTTETTKTLKVPGGARIVQLMVVNVTGTGVVYQVTVDFPGMQTPQTYLVPNQAALQGTEVGSGTVTVVPIPVDIPVKGNISEITIGLTSDTASQTAYVGVKWVAP